MPIINRIELTAAEERFVRTLLDGNPPHGESDEKEVAAQLLEMLAESLTGTSRTYVQRLAARARHHEEK